MFARFDENPAMTLQDIKETKRYGQTHAWTDGWTDNVKTVYPLQTKFVWGLKNLQTIIKHAKLPSVHVTCRHNHLIRRSLIRLVDKFLHGQGLPWLRIVVANTLAKWKKLEPNEINFSQGFSQKVSTSCFVFNSLPAMSADNLYNSLDPDQARQNVGPNLDPNCLTPGWY